MGVWLQGFAIPPTECCMAKSGETQRPKGPQGIQEPEMCDDWLHSFICLGLGESDDNRYQSFLLSFFKQVKSHDLKKSAFAGVRFRIVIGSIDFHEIHSDSAD